MRVWLHKFNTKEDGEFYKLTESGMDCTEQAYARKHFMYAGVSDVLPELVWTKKFDDADTAKFWSKGYLLQVNKYKSVGVPRFKTAAKTFKGVPPDAGEVEVPLKEATEESKTLESVNLYRYENIVRKGIKPLEPFFRLTTEEISSSNVVAKDWVAFKVWSESTEKAEEFCAFIGSNYGTKAILPDGFRSEDISYESLWTFYTT